MNILANDGLSKSGIEKLEEAGFKVFTTRVAQEQLCDFLNRNEICVLLVRSGTKVRSDLIDAVPGLRIIGRGGVGMDNIDVAHAREKGIQVINTPAASSESVAELVFAHLSGMVRFLHEANRDMPLRGESNFMELKKAYGAGRELRGKTLGVVGFGRIGKAVARIALGVGMRVIATDRSATGESPVELHFYDGQSLRFNVAVKPLDTLLGEADFITLHVPAQDKPLIGQREFETMKEHAGLINAARGGVIDEQALIEALEKGRIAYAALDVFEEEPHPQIKLLMNPKLSLSPHIGGSTLEAQERIGTELAEQITRILTAEKLST